MNKKKKIIGSLLGVAVIGVTIYLYRVSTKERKEKAHLAEVNKPLLNPYA